MTRPWQLQEAKNKLSEVIARAVEEGPQQITKHGKETAVVLSAGEYARLRRGNQGLVAFLRNGPLQDLEMERVNDLPRAIDL